jgi:ATP-dependent DNA ligase
MFPSMPVMRELWRRVRADQFPTLFDPCLPRVADRPPAGPGWIHEIKHDDFRILAHRRGEGSNQHYEADAEVIFKHACALGCEGIVSKRRGSRYQGGRSLHWLKVKNQNAPAVRRLEEEDWA